MVFLDFLAAGVADAYMEPGPASKRPLAVGAKPALGLTEVTAFAPKPSRSLGLKVGGGVAFDASPYMEPGPLSNRPLAVGAKAEDAFLPALDGPAADMRPPSGAPHSGDPLGDIAPELAPPLGDLRATPTGRWRGAEAARGMGVAADEAAPLLPDDEEGA